jgi:hypothetical protein
MTNNRKQGIIDEWNLSLTFRAKSAILYHAGEFLHQIFLFKKTDVVMKREALERIKFLKATSRSLKRSQPGIFHVRFYKGMNSLWAHRTFY